MNTLLLPNSFTPESLLALPDGDHFELVDGRLVEKTMSLWASYVAGEIDSVLRECCRGQRLGWVFTAEASYHCFPEHPNLVRRPDVSFIRLGRLPGEQLPEGHCPLSPDLAVEVLSPNDLADEIDRKVHQYLRAGVRLVWVVNPDVRTVRAHRADGTGSILGEDHELTGDDVLPGFRCPVRDFFRPPPGATPA